MKYELNRGRSFEPTNIQKRNLVFQQGFLLAGATRLELATSCVTGMHSNQLNYAPNDKSFYIG